MLNEKQLVKKIAQLKEIKPNENWVSFTKQSILGQRSEQIEKVDVFGWLFNPIKNPAWVVRGVVISALILVGVFFYGNYQNIKTFTETAFKTQANQVVVASLYELQNNLDKITLSLNNLKDIKDQGQALVMTEVIRTTANKGKEMIEQIRESNSSQARTVLASLSGLEESYQELQKTSADMQKEMIESCLNDFAQRSLTVGQATYLEKARNAYNQGKDGEAIIFLSKIGT